MAVIDLVQAGVYPSQVIRLPQVLPHVVLAAVPDLGQVFELNPDSVAEFPQGIRQPHDLRGVNRRSFVLLDSLQAKLEEGPRALISVAPLICGSSQSSEPGFKNPSVVPMG